MSVTLPVVRDRVRAKVRDTEQRKSSVAKIEYDAAIADAYLTLQSRLPAPQLYTANAFTISANAETFTLPTTVTSYGTAEYGGDVRIQLASNALFLTKSTREEVDSLRNGNTLTTGTSKPTRFALWEDSANVVQGICWPRSKDAELCNLFRSMAADDLRDYTVGTKMGEVPVLFSRYGINALVHYTAALIVAGLTDEDLKLRRLNPNVATLWIQEANRILYREEARHWSLQNVGRVQRWIS